MWLYLDGKTELATIRSGSFVLDLDFQFGQGGWCDSWDHPGNGYKTTLSSSEATSQQWSESIGATTKNPNRNGYQM